MNTHDTATTTSWLDPLTYGHIRTIEFSDEDHPDPSADSLSMVAIQMFDQHSNDSRTFVFQAAQFEEHMRVLNLLLGEIRDVEELGIEEAHRGKVVFELNESYENFINLDVVDLTMRGTDPRNHL